ncbi:MAG TPA: sugar kinase [Mycobacteriales bacterium]|nr:sugar kinase [Mycobacteriales bacterium]
MAAAAAEPPIDVLVVGDANPDLLLRGDVVPRFGQAEQLLDAADLVLGGSAAITAAGCARLGLRTALVAAVGADRFGDLVLAALAERGVDTAAVGRDADRPTGLSVLLCVPADRAILTLPGAIPTLDAAAVPDPLLARARHLHVASYFLLPRLAAGLAGLLRRARAAGCTTSLDTNWDPAGRWAGVAELLPLIDVFLPNRAELVAVAGLDGGSTGDPDDAAVAAAATWVRAAGPLLAVKAGAAGALGWNADSQLTAPAPAVDVADPVGAGDSFVAGFLAGWLRGLPFDRCLRWAATAGALSTRAAGGTAAQATAADLERVR